MDKAKWRCVVAGIGGGKTELGAFETIRHIVRYPGIVIAGVSPTYRMLGRSMKPALRKVLSWWPDLPYVEHKSEQEFVFPTKCGPDGSPARIIFCHGGDPNALRAFTAGALWLDEAALCKEDTYRVLAGRLRQPGMPKRGWITCTPKGMNWVYRQFVCERDTWPLARQRRYAFHTWTTYDNPLYAEEPDYLRDLEHIYQPGTDFFRQEVEASFIALRGLVYQMFDAAQHVRKAPPPSELGRTIYGVDWGVTSPGVILALREDRQGNWWLVDEVYEAGRLLYTKDSERDWVTIAKNLVTEHGEGPFFCDPSDTNAIRTFRLNDIPAKPANNRRVDGVRAVQSMIGRNFFVADGVAPSTVAEFGQYHWREDRDGNPIEDQDPAKEHDHAMDALRYALIEVALHQPVNARSTGEVPSFLQAGLQRVM